MNEKYPTEEELDAAYRRASDAEAGRPAALTREAILAEAQVAARRRTPAANEPRYFWRAVAGLAVMGVAVLIWRQTDEPMPGDAPQVTAVEERAISGSAAAESRAPVAQGASSPPAPPPAASARESRTAQKAADASVAVSDRAGQVVADVPPPRPAREATATRPAPAAQSAVLAQQVREVAPRAPATLPEEEFLRLLRARFPTEFQSTQFHRLWLVRDADGQVLLTGELEPEQQLHDLDEQLERGLAGRTPRPWQVRQLQNAAGQRIELAIAEVELGEPRR